MYQNVITFIKKHWHLPTFVISLMFAVFCCISIFQSCNNSVERIADTISVPNDNKVQELLAKVEALERKDSVLQESIKQIDSLRAELHTLKLSISEQYRFLSNRYADKVPKR